MVVPEARSAVPRVVGRVARLWAFLRLRKVVEVRSEAVVEVSEVRTRVQVRLCNRTQSDDLKVIASHHGARRVVPRLPDTEVVPAFRGGVVRRRDSRATEVYGEG